jgi:hypothetical protein
MGGSPEDVSARPIPTSFFTGPRRWTATGLSAALCPLYELRAKAANIGDGPCLRPHGCAARELPLSFRPGRTGRFLVRERDDDDEADQQKSDQISINPIKVFPVEVDTHRTVLLFAEASLTT